MKNHLFILIFILNGLISNAQQPFITTWRQIFTTPNISFNAETTGPVSYSWQTLPPAAPASGSGTFQGPNVTIPGLPPNADIRLSIQPQNFKRFFNPSQINEINQWGTVEWTSMENAFRMQFTFGPGLQVITATDIPNLSNVQSMANMFEFASELNTPFNINFWNISNVTNLSGMFKGCFTFNQALSLWNTANVTNMSKMFESAANFNQNISNWNTSNVTDMSQMFKNAFSFNRNISNWNTSNVTNMSEMFFGDLTAGFEYQFNQNIGNWNTGSVVDMSGMFFGAIKFNQNIGNWNTSNVTNMSNMFRQAFSFNRNLGNWNTSNVVNMSNMFKSDFVNFTVNYPTISTFNNGGSSSIQNWNTANVTDMSGMFFRAQVFNQFIGNWQLNQNVNLVEMLDRSGLDCSNYSQTIIAWNNNPNTPNNKVLGATFLEYGPEAIPAINNLVLNKGWGFSGHDFISTIPSFDFETTYCFGANIPPLPTISIDGINGTWTPALNNTTTTAYSFIPNAGECAATAVVTIFIVPNATPTFTQVPDICQGQSVPALPTVSTNGIVGSWSPPINNTTTTTYTFTPNTGTCANSTTMTIAVITDAAIVPTFAQVSPICAGGTLSALPTTSINGISGTWSPALNNNTTTTYTFTPNTGQCATIASLTININPNVTPTFAQVTPICVGGNFNLPTTSNNGISGTWSPILNNTETTTYTFTPTVGQCATTITLTVTVNPNLTPTFTQVSPICVGGSISPLPTTSNNGINGSWSPGLSNTSTTTYTFTPSAGQCAVTTTLTINVNPIVVPSFTQVEPICAGGNLSPLPAISANGINGTWSPALNNNATTTYTFTPSIGQCATNQIMTVVINQIATPAGDAVQNLPQNSTISNIVINPTNVLWYATLADALANINPLPSNLILQNGVTYFAVNDNGTCRSEPFSVTIQINLSIENNNFISFSYFPNPVLEMLQINNNQIINQVEIYSVLGQKVFEISSNDSNLSLDLQYLPTGVYQVRITADNQQKTFKIIKK